MGGQYANDDENEGEDVMDEVVGSDGDEGREDLDADDDENGDRGDVLDEGVDAHKNENVGQDSPNKSPVVDVELSYVGIAKVVIHVKGNGGCDSSSDDEPLT